MFEIKYGGYMIYSAEVSLIFISKNFGSKLNQTKLSAAGKPMYCVRVLK